MTWPAVVATILIGHGGSPPAPPTGNCTANGGVELNTINTPTIAGVSTVINNASDNAVVCLARGNTWSGTSGLAINTAHADASRVRICGSTSNSCTDSGAANPRILVSGGCVVFGVGAAGYTIQNLDCYNSATSSNSANAYDINPTTSNITIEGGVIDTYWRAGWFDGTGSKAATTTHPGPDNIRFGTCAAPIEIRGTPTGPPGSGENRHVTYGATTNSFISVWVHDFIGFKTNSTDHMIDITQNPYTGLDYLHSTNNLTIECSEFDTNNVTNSNMGILVKSAMSQNLVVRNNTFNFTGTCAAEFGVSFTSHNATAIEGSVGGRVYGNIFNTGRCGAVVISSAHDAQVFNNLAILTMADFNRGLVQFDYNASARNANDLDIDSISIYNNTVFRTGNSSAIGNGFSYVSDNTATGQTPGTNILLANNLFIGDDSVDMKAFSAGITTCNGYGTNGANVHNNFLTSLNDASPSIINCSADDDWIKSGSNPAATGDGWSTKPGLVGDATNWVGVPTTDLVPSSNASKICGQGDTTADALRSQTDYFGNVCTTHDIGAICCPP